MSMDNTMVQKGQHTPGPWRVSYERGATHIRTAGNESIMCNETYYPWVPDNDADWNLISAAPDLLEVLQEILDATSYDHGGPNDLYAKAEKIIAKAKGTTK